jgi:predicted nicotinamide N-methyase
MKNCIVQDYIFANKIIRIEQIDDVEKLVDEISEDEFNSDERLPYWAEVWPAALALAEYVLEHPEEFRNKNIIELGCGMGLLGIAATMVGGNVTFTDYEEQALRFTQNNYFLNFKSKAKTILLGWRKPNINLKFEIIMAADILYEKRFLEPAFQTIKKLIRKNGMIYIAEPNRTIAVPFFDLMNKEFTLISQEPIQYKSSGNKSVSLYKFEKC